MHADSRRIARVVLLSTAAGLPWPTVTSTRRSTSADGRPRGHRARRRTGSAADPGGSCAGAACSRRRPPARPIELSPPSRLRPRSASTSRSPSASRPPPSSCARPRRRRPTSPLSSPPPPSSGSGAIGRRRRLLPALSTAPAPGSDRRSELASSSIRPRPSRSGSTCSARSDERGEGVGPPAGSVPIGSQSIPGP